MGTVNPSAAQMVEFQNLLQGAQNNFPEVLQEMQPSANQIRAFLRARGGRLGNGLASKDVPVLSVRGPLVRDAIATFARKLFLALHYKHTGKIVPHGGGVAMKWLTNATTENDELLSAIEGLRRGLPHAAEMLRSNSRLDNQFSYRFFTNGEGTFSAYFVMFRESFAMVGAVRTDSQDFPEYMMSRGVLSPFPG
jgi:hypothetical protein